MKMIDVFSKFIVTKWFNLRSSYKDLFVSAVATSFYLIFCLILEHKGYRVFTSYVHIFWFTLALFFFSQRKNNKDEIRMVYRERECAFNHSIEELEVMTERIKNTAVEIENREKFLRTILKSLTEGMIGITMKGTIKLCNPAASRLLGFNVHELIGKSICSIFPLAFKDKEQVEEISNAKEDYNKCIRTVAIRKDEAALEIDITISKIKKDLKDFVILTIRQPENYI